MEEFKKITFDVNREIRTIYQIAQYDESTRGFIVTYQSDGVDKDITTEKLVFQGLKADGKKIIQEAEVIDGKFVVSLPRQAATMPGVMLAQLTLLGDMGERLSDKKFKIVVDRDVFGEGLISEDERGILDRAFDFAQDIMPRLEVLDLVKLETADAKESERLASETIRLASEQSRVTAEASRVTKEAERVSNETTRKSSETARVSAETARDSAETARKTAETSRVDAESGRVTAETARVQAEGIRAGLYEDYNTQLSEIKGAEALRVLAESSRATAEQERVTAETGRDNAESDRVTAEQDRVALLSEIEDARDTEAALVARLEALDVPLLENLEQEVITARGTEPTLGARLDSTDAQLAETANNLAEHKLDITQQLSQFNNDLKTEQPKIIELIKGTDKDNIISSLGAGFVFSDYENYKWGKEGIKINCPDARNVGTYLRPTEWIETPLEVPKWSSLGIWFYLQDASKITTMSVEVHQPTTYINYTQNVVRNSNILKDGWNLFRWDTLYNNSLDNFDVTKIKKIDIYIRTNAPTSFTIGSVFIVCPPKAQLLFIQDGGTKSFFDYGYPDLKAREIPITFAVQPSRIGKPSYMSELELAEVGAENNNSISMHSFGDGIPTADMNATELRQDSIKCIQWLKTRGYTGYNFRAAWLQNNAPAHEACQSLFNAYAVATSDGGGSRIDAFPFFDKYKVYRKTLHNIPTETIDLFFHKIKKTNGLLVAYTHDISEGNISNMTPAMWEYFLGKIDIGISEGWLEGVTYEILVRKYGTSFLGE